MGLIRRSRTARPKERAGKLTPRDVEILTTVGRQKVATTHQLTHLYFGDCSTASRRLARLVGMGFLKVAIQDLNSPNLYLLTKKGHAALVHEGVDEESLHLGRLPAREHLEHLCALGDFHVLLAGEVAAREGLELNLMLFEHDLRRLSGSPPPDYLPDLIVRLAQAHTPSIGYAVEIDLGAESAEFIARTKVRTTVALARERRPLFGLDRWRPVLVTSSAVRLRNLAAAIVAEGGGNLWLCTEFARLQSSGVLGSSFATASTVHETPRGETLSYPLQLVGEAP
jgi:hypothetical protein